MHNSYIEHLADGPRAKGQACKFQNLERLSEKKSFNTCVLPIHNVISDLLSRATKPGVRVRETKKTNLIVR